MRVEPRFSSKCEYLRWNRFLNQHSPLILSLLRHSDAIQGDPLAYFRLLSDHQVTSALVPHTLFSEALEAWKQLTVERRPKLSTWDLSMCTQLISYGGSISGEVVKEIRDLLKPARLQNVSFDVSFTDSSCLVRGKELTEAHPRLSTGCQSTLKPLQPQPQRQ